MGLVELRQQMLCQISRMVTRLLTYTCDYIYLDTDERRRFAQVSHEYLIEQLQSFSSSNTLDLNFNHPVKELIWTSGKNSNTVEGNSAQGTSISNFIKASTATDATTGYNLKRKIANPQPVLYR